MVVAIDVDQSHCFINHELSVLLSMVARHASEYSGRIKNEHVYVYIRQCVDLGRWPIPVCPVGPLRSFPLFPWSALFWRRLVDSVDDGTGGSRQVGCLVAISSSRG